MKRKLWPQNAPYITGDGPFQALHPDGMTIVIGTGQGDKGKLNVIQKELKRVLKAEKSEDKLEKQWAKSDMKQAWESMRLMSGYAIVVRSITNYHIPLLITLKS